MRRAAAPRLHTVAMILSMSCIIIRRGRPRSFFVAAFQSTSSRHNICTSEPTPTVKSRSGDTFHRCHPRERHTKFRYPTARFFSDDDEYIEEIDFTEDGLYEEEIEGCVKHSASAIILGESDPLGINGSNEDDISAEERRSLLRAELVRYRIDNSGKKPAYTVLTNAALDGIVNSLPHDDESLLAVKGIGHKKLELFGEDILDIVRRHVKEGGLVPHGDWKGSAINGDDAHKQKKSTYPRPAPITKESLTSEQRRAADLALEGQSVFISGAAGTGKSHVSKYLIQAFREQNRRCSPTAPTGVAAINVAGSTLHSFFGMGLGTGSLSSIVRKVKKRKEVVRRINETDVLLIDEVSMLSSNLLETLDVIAREVREEFRKEPMGGMQIIAVGDFCQLPPIVDRSDATIDFGADIDDQRPFCFDSPAWEELGLRESTVQLKEVQRQESGSRFEAFLGMVRVGQVPDSILRDLNHKCLMRYRTLPDDGIVPTRIYTHNKDVDSENNLRLAELEGDLVAFKAVDEWREKPSMTASVKKGMKAGVASELPDSVELKVGAQVMLTRNRDMEGGASQRSLVNGSRGVVERFDTSTSGGGLPVVRFDNGRVERVSLVEAVRYNPEGGPGVLTRKQLPLKLAWATTVHKSQGSTLSRAILDISRTFEAGQAYVSLSRVKDVYGLFLEKPVLPENIRVSRRVLNYYNICGNR